MTVHPAAYYRDILAELLMSSSGPMDRDISSVCADSRQVQPGALFCAIKGQKADGHDFIPAALAAGAAAIMLERPCALPPDVVYFQVKEPYRAMAVLAEAAAGFPARALRLIGITGTNGKTTSAYLLRHIFQQASCRPAMIGTVVYDLGDGSIRNADRTTPTPFELQELFSKIKSAGANPVVMEVSSHALAQYRLGTAACAATLFTNITRDHLDYHHDFEQYYQAKKLLFTIGRRPGTPMVINADDPYGRRLAEELDDKDALLPFTLHSAPLAKLRVEDLTLAPEGGSFTIRNHHDSDVWRLRTPLPGLFNVYNAAGAAILADAMGVPRDIITRAIADCHGAPGRMQRVKEITRCAVFIDYAHTDDALANALGALRALQPKRLTVVFGCGGNRDRSKRPLMGKVANDLADRIVVTSDNPRDEKPGDIIDQILAGINTPAKVRAIGDRREAIFQALDDAEAGDVILIAGKGHEDYQEIMGVKHLFSDEAVAQDWAEHKQSR
ncbi:MAG: UDP-N-acetylmuramoyl-L-alanyl-D-glutamate--2,6-diaminopimelate ligase [Lentisphaeria bacterium]